MKLRILVLVLVLGVGAIAVGWIYESRLRPLTERADLVIPDNIDYYLVNLRYRAMNMEGNLDYEFESPRLEHYPHTDISTIEIPSLQIFRDESNWQVDANSGEFEHQENVLRLKEQVVMIRQGENPLRVNTDSISFEPDRDLVISDAAISMHSEQAVIEAETATFDLAGRIYRFSNTRATYYDSDR